MKRKSQNRAWLLSVASTYSLMSACGDDAAIPEITGVVVALPKADAGGIDAGIRITPPHPDSGVDAGIVVTPPGTSLDAGIIVTPPDAASDAAPDAAPESVMHGVVVRPPDAR